MSAPVPYFEGVRQMKNAFKYRLRLVTHARQYGIKAAARTFQTTVPSVGPIMRGTVEVLGVGRDLLE
jgi:hypothetical protein